MRLLMNNVKIINSLADLMTDKKPSATLEPFFSERKHGMPLVLNLNDNKKEADSDNNSK